MIRRRMIRRRWHLATPEPARRRTPQRAEQLAYSELMDAMLDEDKRRQKAAKLLAVLRHALGRSRSEGLTGLTAVDVGCSAGFIADELALAGARTFGLDIDEPGLAKARARFGERVTFVFAPGEEMPFADSSVDVVVLNHIYEHVVDPEAVVREIHRVLADDGVLYLGIGNRMGIIEPHYKLPFLSWLPHGPVADSYVRLFGRADHYYERFRTRAGLAKLFAAYDCWDYTLPVLTDPVAFAGEDVVPAVVSRLPAGALGSMLPLVPTYVWVAFKTPRMPAGPALNVGPRRV